LHLVYDIFFVVQAYKLQIYTHTITCVMPTHQLTLT